MQRLPHTRISRDIKELDPHVKHQCADVRGRVKLTLDTLDDFLIIQIPTTYPFHPPKLSVRLNLSRFLDHYLPPSLVNLLGHYMVNQKIDYKRYVYHKLQVSARPEFIDFHSNIEAGWTPATRLKKYIMDAFKLVPPSVFRFRKLQLHFPTLSADMVTKCKV